MSILTDSHIAYVNLARRDDRNTHMIAELQRVGIAANRFDAYEPIPTASRVGYDRVQRMMDTTPGAVGCMYSQISVMLNAVRGNKHACVFEDDLIFCSDFNERMEEFEAFVPGDWEILWLGATFHKEPTWHNTGHRKDFPCECELNRDWEPTNHPNIVRTYGIWSTYAYIVRLESIPKITLLLSEFMPQTIGIDYSMIYLQPGLKTYAFVPGMVKQMDNESNIGKGKTIFSGFAKLGEYWWQDKYDKNKNYMG
jgi:GR25 family glycosyltransferase involved in LPS biosynthesis